MSLSLLTLNVSRPPKERAEPLLAYLWHRPEDVLVLTEVGAGGGSALIAAVARASGFEVLSTASADLGVTMIARGVGLRPDDVPPPALLPSRVLPCVVETDAGDVRVAGVYGAASDPVRYASAAQRQRKRDWLVAFDAWVASWVAGGEGVLIGDLNLVDPVHTDRLPYVLAEETAAYIGLQADHGLVDAWRQCHPDAAAVSWVDHSGVGCRYDHAFVTPGLVDAVAACDLDDAPRSDALTDHSALSLALRR